MSHEQRMGKKKRLIKITYEIDIFELYLASSFKQHYISFKIYADESWDKLSSKVHRRVVDTVNMKQFN